MRREDRERPRDIPVEGPQGWPPAPPQPAPPHRDGREQPQPLWARAASREGQPQPKDPAQDLERARGLLSRQSPEPAHAAHSAHHHDLPAVATYLGEDSQVYTLRDLVDGEDTHVPKRRAAPEAFPPTPQNRAPGAGLLRASSLALLGALLGGAPGVALGIVVALIALVRLSGFERRVSAWRGRARKRDSTQRLPTRATSERLRLMTALWQSLGAITLGAIALFLALTALR